VAGELVIFARVFDLLEWLVPKGESFPRGFRHTVTARLLGAALDLPELLYRAHARRGRARLAALSDADAALNTLRLYLRLAHRWHWLNDGQYEHVSKLVAEIGRLLGGWIRQEQRALAQGLPPAQGKPQGQ
jgi:hypothetical protein